MMEQWSGSDSVMLVVTIIISVLTLGCSLLLTFKGEEGKRRRFINEGGIATAELLSKQSEGNKYRCNYRFYHNGCEEHFQELTKKVRDNIIVFYDPKNPSDNTTLYRQSKWRRMLPSLIPGIAILLMVIAYVMIYRTN